MSKEDNIRRHEQIYVHLRNGDWEGFWGMFPKKGLFNIFGHTPISGCWTNRDELIAKVAEANAEKLCPGGMFAKRSRILVADEYYSVGLMETDAMGTNGLHYDQHYIQIVGHRDNQAVEYWEYLNTTVLEAVIYDNPLAQLRSRPTHPLDIMASLVKPVAI